MSGSGEGLSSPADSAGSITLDAEKLRAFVAAIFEKEGLPAADARLAADNLVQADLRGVWSHGVARTSMYCGRLKAGAAKARPEITVERVAEAAALVDGDDGLGLVVMPRAVEEAAALAQSQGVGFVGVKNSGHFGMAAFYAEMAVERGCLALIFTNASPALPPHGGAEAHFGTSPLAFAAPTPEGAPPFLIDMAMSTVARGKLKFSAQRGEAIPEGLALDAAGRPTTDGAEAFKGTMLPFGGVKGAALSWMQDLLAGCFTGAGHAGTVGNPFTSLEAPQNVGHAVFCLKSDLFLPRETFERRIAENIARAKGLRRAEGVEEILTPGEKEARSAARLAEAGVPLSKDVVEDLKRLGESVGLAWPG
jgi:LDH2 family malate/lactate/ureidoglycolate dehydrogenase